MPPILCMPDNQGAQAMENSRPNSWQYWQMPEYPGNVVQYPQGVVAAHQPINYVPYAGDSDLSRGLQNRAVVPHNPDHLYQQVLTSPTGTPDHCPVVQVVEKHSETTSGSLVEYIYLYQPVASGEFQFFRTSPGMALELNDFANLSYPMSPGFAPAPSSPGPMKSRSCSASSYKGSPSSAPHIHYACAVPASESHTLDSGVGKETTAVPSPNSPPPGEVAQPGIDEPDVPDTPESSSSVYAPAGSQQDCPLAGIDLAILIPESHSAGGMDPDMKLLYLKHLGANRLPKVRQFRNFLVRVRGNFTLHNNRDLPRFDERQQMIASLARHFEDTEEFESIRTNKSCCTTMLKKMHKQRVFLSDGITPEHCILLCVAPFLPCTPNHTISLCAQHLHPYKIPFSSIESLMSASANSQQLRDALGDELLQGDNSTNQLSIILQVMAMMVKTFATKLCQLETDGQNAKEVIIHSKFVAHMMLTALLYCQHDGSTQNISRFLSITGYFLKHLIIINRYRGLCDEASLELTRAMLTLLSHDTGKTELLALMHGTVGKTESVLSVDDQNIRQRLQQKFRNKNDLSPTTKLEDSLVKRGKVLAHSLQMLVIVTLNRCLKPSAVSYYLATLTTLSDLPLFSPTLISQESPNYRALINHLGDVIAWMTQSLQQDSRCYTDYALLRKINDILSTTWIPGLSAQVATLAGWQPCLHSYTSHKQRLFNQLKAPAGSKLRHMPDLLRLVRGLYQLEQESLRTMIEEDKMSREFEAEANALAKKMDELNAGKTQKIARKSPRLTACQSGFMAGAHQQHNDQPAEQPPLPTAPPPVFISTVTEFCRQQDYSQDLATLKAAIPRSIEEKLDCPGHQLWLYTEMAFQGFHQHRELLIRSAKAMSEARRTQKKLAEALGEAKEEFVNKWQSSRWLNKRFTPSELSPKRLAQLVRQTEPKKLIRARRVMGSVLALFKLAIKPGQALLEEVSKNKPPTGDLRPHELMIHFDMCYEAMRLLVGRFKGPLEREVISHEIPAMKTQLFEQLHLYGANSFAHAHHSSADSELRQTLKGLASDVYRQYNQQPFDKMDVRELLNGYSTVHTGLLKYWYHLLLETPIEDPVWQTQASVPEVPGPNPADQQRTDVDANTSEHQ